MASALAGAGSALAASAASGVEIPRTIIVLYDPRKGDVVATEVHRHAEMPLNHLGLVLEYHDVNQLLPDISGRADVRGILTWLVDSPLHDPRAFLGWLERALDAGKRFVSLGDVPGIVDTFGRWTDRRILNRVFERIGVRFGVEHDALGAAAEVVYRDTVVVDFERRVSPPLPFFVPSHRAPGATAHLSIRSPHTEAPADLAVLGRAGGYVARDYVLFRGAELEHRKWLLNPFEFFRRAFATDDLPKPDTTTLSGRRIYYSHIDGDGWRNLSLVDAYARARVMSAEVVLEEAIRPFPDLPVTVAPISADLDLRWYGSREARRIARELLELPQVELGSHTHSHPFSWGYFKNYDLADERRFLARYQKMHGGEPRGWGQVDAVLDASVVDAEVTYDAEFVPRAYAVSPFDLDLEIAGSVRLLEGVTGGRSQVRIMQWSGDTLPFEAALAATAQLGIPNINGGDSRFDTEFPSYAFVAPVGRRAGPYRQIYASNSNENTYTDLWRGRYYAFGFLTETLERTETPLRVRAANVYYHMYSGEREAALKALLDNLGWARSQQLAPIETSRFARIGDGFFTTRLHRTGERQWQVHDRHGLNTLRFDHAGDASVDWSRSAGVIGHRRFQGNLYVALDEVVETPQVALAGALPIEDAPVHLVHARWRVYDCDLSARASACTAEGYGAGEMSWRGRPGAAYAVEVLAPELQQLDAVANEAGVLSFDLGPSPHQPVRFRIRVVSEDPGA